MRVLTAMNLFKEVEEGTYTAAPLAGAFIDDSPLAAAAIHMFVNLPQIFLIYSLANIFFHERIYGRSTFQVPRLFSAEWIQKPRRCVLRTLPIRNGYQASLFRMVDGEPRAPKGLQQYDESNTPGQG